MIEIRKKGLFNPEEELIYGKYNNHVPELGGQEFIRIENDTNIEISDGHHTMTELYNHRHALFCALCKIYDNYVTPFNTRVHCWKSKLHQDGTMFDGWFIAGMTINQFTGPVQYITYHLPLSWWDKFNIIEMERAPEWDGHTSDDVLERLVKL